jgi:hypothetical protein
MALPLLLLKVVVWHSSRQYLLRSLLLLRLHTPHCCCCCCASLDANAARVWCPELALPCNRKAEGRGKVQTVVKFAYNVFSQALLPCNMLLMQMLLCCGVCQCCSCAASTGAC